MSKKTKADPTGQAGNRNKGTKRLFVRLGRAEVRVKNLFKQIKRERRRISKIKNNEQQSFYEYDLSSNGQEQLNQSIQFILNDELLTTQENIIPFNWYWKENIELPYRQGTVEEVRDFNQLVTAAIVAGATVKGLSLETVPIERVVFSEAYREALNGIYVSNFNTIKSLSDETSSKVIRVIDTGISTGASAKDIGKDITERFDVARSSAQRIAETEVNKAYNDAKLNATDLMAEQTGLRAAVIHISALTSTTRPHHAARHGNAYTTADQLTWWDSGANRINCKCSTKSVLINSKGKVVQSELQEEIKKERSFFD